MSKKKGKQSKALWSPESTVPESVQESNVISTDDLYSHYDFVDFGEGGSVLVVPKTEPSRKMAEADVSLRELGYAAPSPFTSWTRREYNVQLVGSNGLRIYDQMRRSDATVRGSLRLLKTPVWAARWFVEPASKSTADQNIADFVWWNMTQRMTYGFECVLEEALLMLDFGWYAFEKVWAQDVWKGRDVTCWDKLAPRHPMDVMGWDYDKKGGPDAIVMYPNPALDEAPSDQPKVPIDKLVAFTYQKEAGNMEGISILRAVYKHWYYKEQMYKIDAIQKERHSIGIPIIILPPGYTPEDKKLADEMGRNLRTNDRAHVVLPPLWQIQFADVRTNLVNPLDSIEHHDLEIQKNILAPFMDKAGKEEDTGFFLKNARDVGNIVTRTFNDYAIKQLVDFNYTRLPNGYPKLRVRRIGEENDWRTMSFAVRNMIGAGAIVPDDVLEEFLRDLMDLPKSDPETARLVAGANVYQHAGESNPLELPAGAPQTSSPNALTPPPGKAVPAPKAPSLPRVGPPRQQPSPPVGLPRGNGGIDRSGGR
jgi:hypothetical protein